MSEPEDDDGTKLARLRRYLGTESPECRKPLVPPPVLVAVVCPICPPGGTDLRCDCCAGLGSVLIDQARLRVWTP